MVKNRATIKQQLISGCLLVVFLLITSIKFFHSHESSAAENYPYAIAQLEKLSECSICDYQLTKDSDLTTELLQVNKIIPSVSSYSFYNTTFVTSIGSTSSGRGPPALV
jgi:hypothetical protein